MRSQLVLAFSVLLACSPAPANRSDAADRRDTAQATASDRSAAEAVIRRQETGWRSLIKARDTAKIKEFYTEDAVYAPQGTQPIRGRAEVSARWAREFMIPGFDLERTPLRIEVASSGEIATEVGTYRVRFTEKNKQRNATGAYMTAWRRVGDEWLTSSYMWNLSAPE